MVKQVTIIGLIIICCLIMARVFAQEQLPPMPQSAPATEIATPPVSSATTMLPPLPQQADLRQWNLQNVDIKNVVEEVARVTGKNFIIDPALTGNVTVISNQQMTADELYELFLSMLQVLGFAAVDSDGAVKVVPDVKARQLGTFIATDGNPGSRDAIVARVISVEHVPSAQLVPVLRNLVSPEGHLAAYAPSNSLLVVDRGENAQRIAEIVKKLDRAETDGMDMIQLEHASADEVVASLEALVALRRQTGEAPGGGQVAIAADERSNSVLLSGDKSRRLQLQAIIAQLDVDMPGEGNTEVVYLRFQRAEDLVPVLANIMDSYASAQNESITPGAALAQIQPQQQQAGTPQITPPSDAGEGYRTFTDRQATGVSVGGYGIHAEPNMNALVITAPSALMRNLRNVVAQLDVRRAQVMVEAIIVEIEDTELEELGIEWRGGGVLVGGTAFPSADGMSPLDTYQATLNDGGTGLPTSGLNVGFIQNGSIKFLINALSSNTNANILSTPSLVALDNAEAQITVGNQIPFPLGSYATTDGSNTVTPFNTFEYREVGLTLRIKPQITQGDAVVLQIQQNVDSIGAPTADGDPTTINRDITTSVLVNDKDILVLGGLIRTQENDNIYKVPYLGDLPLIGNFFRAQNTTTSKTNLMIFIRPTILRDATESLEVTGAKYNWMRNQQILDNTEDYQKQIPESHGRLAPFEVVEPSLPMPFQPSKDVSDPHLVITTDDIPNQ
ncbi:MAG: type II secretion system secretin GspD [Gammaproteobacteria bacterium]|jgi:general secretion pathway protein D